MLTTFTLSLPPNATVLVKKGDKIKAGEVVAEEPCEVSEKHLNLSSILNIPANKISQVLTRPIGSKVSRGDVIARLRHLFTELVVRSPIDAKISSVDLSKGSVLLITKEEKEVSIKSPIEARVKNVDNDSIKLVFDGSIFEIKSGKGTASGELFFLKGGGQTMFQADYQVMGKVVLVDPNDALIAKLQALEAVGIITTEETEDQEEVVLPYGIIDVNELDNLVSFVGKKVVLDGEQGYVIVLE